MRLSPLQIHAIVAATAERAGPDALVRLFGSRRDDALHGGDIDLLVECPNQVARPVWLAAQITADDKLLPALLTCLGEGVGSVVLDNLDRAGAPGLADPAQRSLDRCARAAQAQGA